MKNSLVARANPDLQAVWEWYEFQRDLLVEARSHVLRRNSLEGNEEPERPYDGRFLAREADWVKAFFRHQLNELEFATMLEMLSTVEAALRLDFRQRVSHRVECLKAGANPGHGSVSRKLYGVDAMRGRHVRFDEDILETWKSEASVNVGDFRGAWKLRDWLAHGRYWHPNLGRGYDSALVYGIAEKLLAAISSAPEGLDLPSLH